MEPNSDFKELLNLLNEEKVRYLIVGGYAVIHYEDFMTPESCLSYGASANAG